MRDRRFFTFDGDVEQYTAECNNSDLYTARMECSKCQEN